MEILRFLAEVILTGMEIVMCLCSDVQGFCDVMCSDVLGCRVVICSDVFRFCDVLLSDV